MATTNRAAFLSAPGIPLSLQETDTHNPGPGEVSISNHAIAIQPLDAKMLIANYGPASQLTFPAILGTSGAGVIKEVGEGVVGLQAGDRVVFDTKAYVDPAVNKRQGTWQQVVVSDAKTVAKVQDITRDNRPMYS
jgi:NADPH:quinone reductase-like Zn-dependent oxidoreductase